MKTTIRFSKCLFLMIFLTTCSVPRVLASWSNTPPENTRAVPVSHASYKGVSSSQAMSTPLPTATLPVLPSPTPDPTLAPAPLVILDPAETLRVFLTDLANGVSDPSLYQQAASLFGGSLKRIQDNNPRADKDPANLLQIVCENEGYRCLPVRQISPAEKLSDNRYRLWVQFNLPDGSLYKLPSQPLGWIDFIVAQTGDGQTKVMDLPTLYFGCRDTFDPVDTLTTAEINGLDDSGILRALWVDWMNRYRSSFLEDRVRLTDFDVNQVTQDDGLSEVVDRTGLTAAGYVSFSVRPVNVLTSDWLISGGDVVGDWINNYSVVIGYRHEGDFYRLVIIDVNP